MRTVLNIEFVYPFPTKNSFIMSVGILLITTHIIKVKYLDSLSTKIVGLVLYFQSTRPSNNQDTYTFIYKNLGSYFELGIGIIM